MKKTYMTMALAALMMASCQTDSLTANQGKGTADEAAQDRGAEVSAGKFTLTFGDLAVNMGDGTMRQGTQWSQDIPGCLVSMKDGSGVLQSHGMNPADWTSADAAAWRDGWAEDAVYSYYGFWPAPSSEEGSRTSLIESQNFARPELDYSFFGPQTDDNVHLFQLLVSDPEWDYNTYGRDGNQLLPLAADVQLHFRNLMAFMRLQISLADGYEGQGVLTEWGVAGTQVWTSGKLDLLRCNLRPDRKDNEEKKLVRKVGRGGVTLTVGDWYRSDMVIHPVQLSEEGTFYLWAIVDGKRFEWPVKKYHEKDVEPGYMLIYNCLVG